MGGAIWERLTEDGFTCADVVILPKRGLYLRRDGHWVWRAVTDQGPVGSSWGLFWLAPCDEWVYDRSLAPVAISVVPCPQHAYV